MSIGRWQAKQIDIEMIEAPIDNTATVFKVSPKSVPFSLPDDKKMSNKKHSENTDISTSVTINECKKILIGLYLGTKSVGQIGFKLWTHI